MPTIPNRAKLKVLIVEPDFASAKMIEALLRESGFTPSMILRVIGLHEAADALRKNKISVCLVNAVLDGACSAHDLIDLSLKMPTPPPVIVISNTDDLKFDEAGQQLGAAHYVLKREITAAGLERLIRYTVGQHQNTTNQTFAAQYDSLTGLLRQSAFMDRLTQALHRANRSQHPVCVARLDLQNFESINTTHGHDIGDVVLQAIAHRLESKIRKTDTTARFGSDEFACLLENFGAIDSAVHVIQKLALGLKAPVHIEGQTFTVPVAIGVAFYPAHGEEADSLIHRADVALQSARVAAASSGQSKIVTAD